MNKFFHFCILLLLLTLCSTEAKKMECNTSSFISVQKTILTSNNISDYTYLSINIDEQSLYQLMSNSGEIIITQFPLAEGRNINLNLIRSNSVVDCNTKFYTQSKYGQIKLPNPDVSFFSGTVVGYPDSKVFFTNVDGLLYGVINLSETSSFIISPASDKHQSSGNYNIINQMYLADKDLKLLNFGITDEKQKSTLSKPITQQLALDWSILLEFGLALETDTEFYKACGSDIKKAQAYAISIINMVSVLYTREVNISIYLKWLKTWTDSPVDPYNVKGDAYSLSPKVHDYWLANYSDVERDLAHVMTSISYGGGGFGYYNAICNQAGEYSFSVSSMQGNHTYPTVDFTYDVYTVAHEIGHNFNASHTHSCVYGYPLDTCVADDAIQAGCLDQSIKARPNPGSIMSYCGVANNNAGLGYWVRMMFLPQSKNDIRNTAVIASCMKEPQNPKIILNLPQGKEVLKYGDTLTITWSAVKVSKVNLSYTEDGGLTWLDIAKNIDASLFQYKWTVPDICSNNMYIKITQSLVDSVNDIQKIPFSIIKTDPNGLVASYPFSGNYQDVQDCHFYNLTNSGTSFVNDRSGSQNSAVKFSGSNYLSTPFAFDMNEITLAFWFFAEDMAVKRNIIGSNYQEGWVTEIYLWGQFGASWYVDGQGSPKQIWGGTPSLKKWHHGAFTWDGTTAKLYLDGVKVNESSDGKHTLNKFSNTPLYIGSRKDNDYFKGLLDDIYIYRRALNDQEIMTLYNFKTEDVKNDIQPDEDLIISPNPAKDKIYIYSANTINGLVILYDNLGNQLIKTENIIEGIDVSILSNGIYYLNFMTSTKSIFRKIIINR